MIGHNQPNIDNVVEENLLRGLYLTQLEALQRCIGDPQMRRRHHQVLCQIIKHTNSKTGMAYPGRARLAQEIIYYVNGEERRYSESTIATTITELVEAGYLVYDKRAPNGKGRALAHYAVTKPTNEELQARITEWCLKLRGSPKREHPAAILKGGADVDAGDNVNAGINLSAEMRRNSSEVDARINVRSAEVDTGVNVNTRIDVNTRVGQNPADVDTRIPTVTGKDSTGRKYSSSIELNPSLEPASFPAKLSGQTPAKRAAIRKELAHDWRPSGGDVSWVRESYVATDRQIAREVDKFRNHHIAKGSKMADWSAAWRTWWGYEYHGQPRRAEALAPLLDAVQPDERQAAYLRELDEMGAATLSHGRGA